MKQAHEIADFLENTWFEKRGLAAAIVLCLATFPVLASSLGTVGAAITVAILSAITFVTWLWSRKPGRTPPGKIGFVISISCSNDEESRRLQEDFVRPLRELLKSGKTSHVFHVIEVPQHIASRVLDIEQATALRIQCRAHFIIHGRVRLRELAGKELHILDLEGGVAHTPVPHSVSQLLAAEFTELMPRKLHIEKENDLLAFQFTSEWADLVSRYVIGLAAEISGDLDYAETLFQDARARLHGKNTNFPIYSKLKERLPLRISEIHLARAQVMYGKWVQAKDSQLLVECEKQLGQLIASHQNDRMTQNMRAILAFVLERDVNKAIALIKGIKGEGQPLWHLNMAFLLGYKGELKNAIRHYRLAAVTDADDELLTEVEKFIEWVLIQEPGRYQLHYCLGFFNWRFGRDLNAAISNFQQFLAKIPAGHKPKEVELAQQWIDEIEKGKRVH